MPLLLQRAAGPARLRPAAGARSAICLHARTPFGATCALLLILGAVGCKGGEGDPCKTQDDCGGGLACCPIDRSPLERGSCETVCSLGTLPPGLDAGFFSE